MAAEKGNKYWQFREKHGRDYKYTSEALWEEAVKYFDWVEENPLKEEKVFHAQGVITKAEVSKMRAMTIAAFCLFADISYQTFENYKKEEDFFEVITRIDGIIRSQKFEGAAGDLLNANIIARDLGIKEHQQIEQTNVNIDMSETDRQAAIDRVIKGQEEFNDYK